MRCTGRLIIEGGGPDEKMYIEVDWGICGQFWLTGCCTTDSAGYQEQSLPVDCSGLKASSAIYDGVLWYRRIPWSGQYPVTSLSCLPIVPFSSARVLCSGMAEFAHIDITCIPVKWLKSCLYAGKASVESDNWSMINELLEIVPYH